MMHKCHLCDKPFSRNTSAAKFCCHICYRNWKCKQGIIPGGFKKGLVPWNKGSKGVMKVNSGSFSKGRESDTRELIGAVTQRTDKTGKVRAWVKINDNGNPYDWKLRAQVVWEKTHGSIPDGKVLHHKDRNTLNDRMENLQLLSKAEHLKEHRHEFNHKRKKAAAHAAKIGALGRISR